MIIEFELQGSRCLHKGVFDTTGFWAKFEEESEIINQCKDIEGYKIYSHFSFSFFHEDKEVVETVWEGLTRVLEFGNDWDHKDIGFIVPYK